LTEFKPSDPNFDARLRDSFARQQVMQTLGISIERLAAGEIEPECLGAIAQVMAE
jgi:hypothetical protein